MSFYWWWNSQNYEEKRTRFQLFENSHKSNEMTQLHKIVSNHDKNDLCCEYLEVTVMYGNPEKAKFTLIMNRVSSNEYHGYTQFFRASRRPNPNETPDFRNSWGSIFRPGFWELNHNCLRIKIGHNIIIFVRTTDGERLTCRRTDNFEPCITTGSWNIREGLIYSE